MQLRPKRVREAAAQWERITNEQGFEARDAMWGHPDMLPALPNDDDTSAVGTAEEEPRKGSSIDWDAELSRLLDDDGPAANGSDASDPDQQG